MYAIAMFTNIYRFSLYRNVKAVMGLGKMLSLVVFAKGLR